MANLFLLSVWDRFIDIGVLILINIAIPLFIFDMDLNLRLSRGPRIIWTPSLILGFLNSRCFKRSRFFKAIQRLIAIGSSGKSLRCSQNCTAFRIRHPSFFLLKIARKGLPECSLIFLWIEDAFWIHIVFGNAVVLILLRPSSFDIKLLNSS